MCTAATYKTKDFYFGRTLDYEISYGDQVVITPRNYVFDLREGGQLKSHYAMIGMACVMENYPLYYDAVNWKCQLQEACRGERQYHSVRTDPMDSGKMCYSERSTPAS